MSGDTGFDFEQVGRLTLPRYRAIYRRFETHPPVQWMVAAFIGIGGAEGGATPDIDINDIDLPPGGLRIGGL